MYNVIKEEFEKLWGDNEKQKKEAEEKRRQDQLERESANLHDATILQNSIANNRGKRAS